MARGKRYTEEERQKVIDFARAHDKKNGRGGKAAAAKKFGVNINSVMNWMSSSNQPKVARSTKPAAPAKSTASPVKTGNKVDMLEKLIQIQKKIDGLNEEYESIKSKL
ncbi:MAG: hypothetical protein P1V20_29955 [Verrucomicrobiales bacterium]|nr:hypothetical protein [Verrucomicrobiales bacterium]